MSRNHLTGIIARYLAGGKAGQETSVGLIAWRSAVNSAVLSAVMQVKFQQNVTRMQPLALHV